MRSCLSESLIWMLLICLLVTVACGWSLAVRVVTDVVMSRKE
jgi:hypothetical protein